MSWEQLGDILRQARAQTEIEGSEPPTACPIDGEPLEIHTSGVRACPLGNYRWDGGSK